MSPKPKPNKQLPEQPLGPMWIPENEVLSRFNISLKTLRRWYQLTGLPKYKIGRLSWYKEKDLNEMLEKHRTIHQLNKEKARKKATAKNSITPRAINVGIVDDHVSATTAYTMLLNSMAGVRAVLEAFSADQLFEKLKVIADLPDILLMDVIMDEVNGIDAAKQVSALYPTIKIIAFSGNKDDWPILQMIRAGACAYLSKSMSSAQIKEAIYEVHLKGKYEADLFHLYSVELRNFIKEIKNISLTDNEKRFLQLLCKGYNFAQMAEEMKVTRASVNYYNSCLSTKLHTKSQVIMALQAQRMGIVSLRELKIWN